MNNRHFRKSIDKVVRNLMKYLEKTPWDSRFAEYYSEIFDHAADELGITSDALEDALSTVEYHDMIFGFLFEDFAMSQWDNENESFIDCYLFHRGWRETTIGRRYLQAMNGVTADLWEIVSIEPGEYADVRLHAEKSTPMIRVYEKSATQSLDLGDCIATKVIQLDGKHLFTGGVLKFSSELADTVEDVMDRAIKENIRRAKDQFALDKKSMPANLTETETEYVHSQRTEILPTIWVIDLYHSLNSPMPKIVNKDGDSFQFSTVRFPFDHQHREEILACLNNQFDLDYVKDNDEWVWLPCSADEIPKTGVSILGHIILTNNTVDLKVNSTARAESGQAYLAKLLNGWVKQPLTLHETVESVLDRH